MTIPSHFERKAQIRGAIEELKEQLAALEDDYAVLERYESIMGLGICDGKPFSELTKAEAAIQLLNEAGGSLKVKEIFARMKDRSHPVQDAEAMRTLLEKDDRFVKVEPGVYDLTSRLL